MIEIHWLSIVSILIAGMSIGVGIGYFIMKDDGHE